MLTGGLLLCDVVEGDVVAAEEGGDPQQQQHVHLLHVEPGQLPQHLLPFLRHLTASGPDFSVPWSSSADQLAEIPSAGQRVEISSSDHLVVTRYLITLNVSSADHFDEILSAPDKDIVSWSPKGNQPTLRCALSITLVSFLTRIVVSWSDSVMSTHHIITMISAKNIPCSRSLSRLPLGQVVGLCPCRTNQPIASLISWSNPAEFQHWKHLADFLLVEVLNSYPHIVLNINA